MPVVKPIDYTGIFHELNKLLNSLPDLVEKFEKNVSSIKTLSSVFTDNKNQLLYMDEQSVIDRQNYEIKTKNQSLEFLTEEIKKFDRIIIHKNMLNDLEEKCSKLQKYIDSELEKDKKAVEDKYNDDLENKLQMCKILAEKDKIQYESQLEYSKYKIEFLEKLVQKYEGDKS